MSEDRDALNRAVLHAFHHLDELETAPVAATRNASEPPARAAPATSRDRYAGGPRHR